MTPIAPPNHPRKQGFARLTVLAGVAALGIGALAAPVSAQGLSDPEAVDRIIGSEVREQEVKSSAGDGRVIAAIEKLGDNLDAVRKITTLDRVDIVYLPQASRAEGGPAPEIATKLSEHSDSVDTLRHELQSNALLYHAINSKNVQISDVLAVEFDADATLVVFAAAKPSS
ncbi:hypothetical protein [Hoeflea olei]|uniref:Uncharacterized protein n=1 Tax=Hoeflea olei TaxID=1480615 RepID=A0A1C1YQ86_9HYPH|nr:hypothetical protein [Hoeflea olei]OCW55530.1 hypothetical protein AWJ14_05925 [Hoeflea olei]